MKALLPIAVFCLSPLLHAQNTWYVDAASVAPGSGTIANPYSSLQYAVDQSTTLSGDSLEVAAGTYDETVDLGFKELSINAPSGPAATILNAGGQGAALVVAGGQSSSTRIVGLQLTGGTGFPLSATEFPGGNLYVSGSSPSFENCLIAGGEGTVGGGGYLVDSNSQFTRVAIRGNIARDLGLGSFPYTYGGGLSVAGNSAPSFSDCLFHSNRARYGGGYNQDGGSVSMSGCVFEANVLDDYEVEGAGARLSAVSPATLDQCAWRGNISRGFGFGGGLFVESAQCLLTGCLFEDNVNQDCCSNGGGLWCGGNIQAADSTFTGNKLYYSGKGGAVYGTLVARNCSFVDNHAAMAGGMWGGTAIDSTFDGNLAINADGDGSGYGGGAMQSSLIRCELTNNAACGSSESFGGAAFNCSLSHCVVAKNAAYANSTTEGGGLHGCTASHCTIVENTRWPTDSAGSLGAGVFGGSLTNCIVRSNAPDNFAGPMGSVVFTNSGQAQPGIGNFDADPLFLGSENYHLLPGSPCIDSGDPSLPADPDGSLPDVGAFPYDPAALPSVSEYCSSSTVLCEASLGLIGVPSATSATPATVRATGTVAGTLAILFASHTATATPIAQGTLCIGQPQIRFGVHQTTGTPGTCDGTFDQDIPASWYGQEGFAPGDIVLVQAIYREAGTIGLSKGLLFRVDP